MTEVYEAGDGTPIAVLTEQGRFLGGVHPVGPDDIVLLRVDGDLTAESADALAHNLPASLRGRTLVLDSSIDVRTLAVPGLDPTAVAQVIADVLAELQTNAEASDVHTLADLRADVGQRLTYLSRDEEDD